MRKQLLAAALTTAMLLAACGGSGHDHNKLSIRKHATTSQPEETSTTTTAPDGVTSTSTVTGATATTRHATSTSPTTGAAPKNVTVKANQMASLQGAIALATRTGESDTVYIAQKGGIIRRLRVMANSASVDAIEVLNISKQVATGPEQGLLGLAFSPDGNTLYVDYTDLMGDTQIVAYPYSGGTAKSGSVKTIVSIPHPQYANHNGGQLTFGPDGYLYVGTGDGGGAGDPFGNAQNLGSLRGKILRIVPNPAGGYAVPADNPFVHTSGAKGEVWQWGLRNPWRFSFDRQTGEQWIGDVGQDAYEEIDHVGAGAKGVNFGWNEREGRHPYNGGAEPAGAVDPEIEVPHSNGSCAIVGGYVYRGTQIPGLVGTYLFTDNCRGAIVAATGGVTRDVGVSIAAPTSMGEDSSGELWVLSLNGPVFRLAATS